MNNSIFNISFLKILKKNLNLIRQRNELLKVSDSTAILMKAGF